ncbi:MAG: hypothetical protein D6701_08165, partial [Gemmatimonadetes bacterium]
MRSVSTLFLFAPLVAALGCQSTDPRPPGPSLEPSPKAWGETAPASDESVDNAGKSEAQIEEDRKTREAKKRKLSPEEFAKALPSAKRCEYEARKYYDAGKTNKGWKLLMGCVKRGDFTHLKPLLEEPWLTELGKRRGGAEMLAHVMATRGGDVSGDLRLLHEKRVPVFSLSSAIAEPEVYEDRLIILRGRVGERRKEGDRFAATIAETSLESHAAERTLGSKYVSERKSSYRSNTRASGRYNTSRYGRGTGSYKRSYGGSGSSRYSSKRVV